jgi:hypothetical protein
MQRVSSTRLDAIYAEELAKGRSEPMGSESTVVTANCIERILGNSGAQKDKERQRNQSVI